MITTVCAMNSSTTELAPTVRLIGTRRKSGGFTPMARKNMVRVTRTLNGVKETYKLPVEKIAEGERPNFPMLPGDQVFVPERPW